MVTTRRKPTTNEKGLGWVHRHQRAALMRTLRSGIDKCSWCGRPMYDDDHRHKNYDFDEKATNPNSGKLHADHSDMSRAECVRRGIPMPKADRLLHGACNIQRGDGGNDHLAVGNGKLVETTQLAMAWPF